MPDTDLQKHTLNLFAGDYEELQAIKPDVPASVIIRNLVRNFINQMRANDEVPEVKITL